MLIFITHWPCYRWSWGFVGAEPRYLRSDWDPNILVVVKMFHQSYWNEIVQIYFNLYIYRDNHLIPRRREIVINIHDLDERQNISRWAAELDSSQISPEHPFFHRQRLKPQLRTPDCPLWNSANISTELTLVICKYHPQHTLYLQWVLVDRHPKYPDFLQHFLKKS